MVNQTRTLMLTVSCCAFFLLFIFLPIISQNGVVGAQEAEEKEENVTLLYVLSSAGATYKDGVLTLKNVSSQVVYFSDRPDRIAGHMNLLDFLDDWNEGPDSFEENPPNAALSIVNDSEVNNPVVEISDPKLTGEDLSFNIRKLDGELPSEMGPLSVFIDVVVVHRGAYVRHPYRGPHTVVVRHPYSTTVVRRW